MIHAEKLHASLALLPVDATQVDYLFRPPAQGHSERTSRCCVMP